MSGSSAGFAWMWAIFNSLYTKKYIKCGRNTIKICNFATWFRHKSLYLQFKNKNKINTYVNSSDSFCS